VVLAAPFVAFLLNAVRAVALIVNPHSAIATVHVAQGVAILLVGLLALYALDGLLERLFAPAVPARPAAAAAAPARAARPTGVLVYLGLLALASVAVRPWASFVPAPLALENFYARSLGSGQGSPLPVDDLFLGSVVFRESLSARYQRDGDAVDVFVGVGDRGRRFTSVLSPKTELPGSGWVVEERWRCPPGAERPEAEGLVIRSGARWRLVRHWTVASKGPMLEAVRSLLALDATPWRRAHDPLVIRLSTPLEGPGRDQRELAEARLLRMADGLEPIVEGMLRDMGMQLHQYRRKAFSRFSASRKFFSDANSARIQVESRKSRTCEPVRGWLMSCKPLLWEMGVPEGTQAICALGAPGCHGACARGHLPQEGDWKRPFVAGRKQAIRA
jgi:hypothetical protein